MSVTKQEQPAADPRKMDFEQLDALAEEALDSDNPTEYQYSVVEAYMEQARERRVEREMEREVRQEAERAAEREMEREVRQEAERDLQRWLKWQREVGIHRAFARDYARYMARISC